MKVLFFLHLSHLHPLNTVVKPTRHLDPPQQPIASGSDRPRPSHSKMGDGARRTETAGGGSRTVDMEEHELGMDGLEHNGKSERQKRKRRRVEDDP